jgi:hypothetical protein
MGKRAIELGFKRALNEIEVLQSQIHLKKGVWIFQLHRYSGEELGESVHYDKIYAITEKLGDDVGNWHRAGKLTNQEFDFYHGQRDVVEDRLKAVRLEIINRKPTFLETLLESFDSFFETVVVSLPRLQRFLPVPISAILWFLPSSFSPRRLMGSDEDQQDD